MVGRLKMSRPSGALQEGIVLLLRPGRAGHRTKSLHCTSSPFSLRGRGLPRVVAGGGREGGFHSLLAPWPDADRGRKNPDYKTRPQGTDTGSVTPCPCLPPLVLAPSFRYPISSFLSSFLFSSLSPLWSPLSSNPHCMCVCVNG